MSTDMYLPALPLLGRLWGQPEAAINLTLVLWFVTYCVFLLVYGPVSDRVGRRPPLLWGVGLFIVASLGCAMADGLVMLLAARVAQAAGAAASTVMAMAMAKDLFEMRQRAKVLAYISVINALAPMLAPTLGGWIMAWLSWRWVFAAQALLAAALLPQIARMSEPLQTPLKVKASHAVLAYARLFKNWRFSCLNAAMALPNLAMFAFIAASPAIYISGFGLSESVFGYFFGFNALAMMMGAYGYSFFGRGANPFGIMLVSFAGMVVGGAGLIFLPHQQSPWMVALPMWVVSFCIGLNRPPANNLILEQVSADTGSASSLIALAIMSSGAVAMFVASLAWADKAAVIGVLAMGGGAAAFMALLAMRGRLAGLEPVAAQPVA